jgi:hypothetical protein
LLPTVKETLGIVPTKRCQKLGMLVDAVNEATLKESSTWKLDSSGSLTFYNDGVEV